MSAQPPRRLTVEELAHDHTHTLVLTGSLELSAVDTFDAAIARLWDREARRIVVDLRGLTFIDSSGLWAITSLHKWCLREAIGFSLVRGPDAVHRVFELTGLSDVLPFSSEPPA